MLKFLTIRHYLLVVALGLLMLQFLTSSIVYGQQAQSVVVSLNFRNLPQGTASTIFISGTKVKSATATLLNHSFPCFFTNTVMTCLIAVPIDTKLGKYPLKVSINDDSGSTLTWAGQVTITSGQFLSGAQVLLPARLLYLLQPDIEANENKRLLSIYNMTTPERYWEGQFTAPASGSYVSTFGSIRAYNDGILRRHTGYDVKVPVGTPVKASSNGRIVFAQHLDIHGNIVVLDHGEGVFSSYSHLSEIYVVPGQFVLQGDVIGLSGTTGRSTGPHIHWEIAVSDVWVNPVTFAQLQLTR